MSLRAIRKRECHQKSFGNKSTTTRDIIGIAANGSSSAGVSGRIPASTSVLSSVHSLLQQQTLLGRATYSNPEVYKGRCAPETAGTQRSRLVSTKSESDVATLLKNFTSNASNCAGSFNRTKSEVCLHTISVHDTPAYVSPRRLQRTNHRMLTGAQSHRDLSQSSYGTAINVADTRSGPTARFMSQRRMSECSSSTSAISSSIFSLDGGRGSGADVANAVVRVPIIGYEVMEERARFTVYKLRVENPCSNDCWLVLRRYTDFVRLNNKLKQAFPYITLALPRKKIFGDNFNSVFLDNRVQGLQMFVNSVMVREELRRCKLVREFFCLDEPPTYSESMEECRAIFEAQEETIAHLKMQISNKNDLILNLQQRLREEIVDKEQLRNELSNLTTPERTARPCPNGDVRPALR